MLFFQQSGVTEECQLWLQPSFAAVPEMAENTPGEPLVPNEPEQHQGGGGPKFESLRAFTGDGNEDAEVFRELPEVNPCTI